jgi:CDP-4-dehydro-6-deoxyglucose reductase
VPTVKFLMGDKEWSAEAGRTISLLDLALSKGLPVNYSCRRGDCGQCVARLRDGSAAPIDPQRPVSRDGGIYLCNAVPRDDLVVELPYFSELQNIRVLRSPCKIDEVVPLSDDVLLVSVRLPPAVQFKFLPGQYIRITNKERITRSYSLANAPAVDRLLRFHVRRVDKGAFSRYLFESAKPGDLLQVEGPMGQFILRNAIVVQKTIFLATGTGIAPVHAILSSLDDAQLRRCGDLFLYWGNRRPEDAYFIETLHQLAQRIRLRHFELFSRAGAEANQIARHVQDLLDAHHSDLHDAQVFASGNASMVDDARQRALALGLPPEKYFADAFTAS